MRDWFEITSVILMATIALLILVYSVFGIVMLVKFIGGS
jgi:hypothetical protein